MNSDDRGELAAQFFALLTATLEDAAVLALEGQGRKTSIEDRIGLAPGFGKPEAR